jgi:hypothetical protein
MLSFRTAVTSLVTLAVSPLLEELAGSAICCALIELHLFMGFVPGGCHRAAPPKAQHRVLVEVPGRWRWQHSRRNVRWRGVLVGEITSPRLAGGFSAAGLLCQLG